MTITPPEIDGKLVIGFTPIIVDIGDGEGTQGPQGDPGVQGETGTTPRLTIGSVTSTDSAPSASITGTTDDPILNFVLQRGEPGSDGTGNFVSTDPQTLTTPQIKQALLNTKSMPVLRPEQFGAVADGLTDDSIPFYNCIQAGLTQPGAGCYIQLQQGAKYFVGQAAKSLHGLTNLVDLHTGIYLGVPGGSGRASAGATLLIGDHTFSGYIIGTPTGGVQGCGINGILVESDMSSAGASPIGGVLMQGVAWGHVRDVGIGNVTDIGLNVLGCVDMHLENIAVSHKITGRTLADVTPAFFLSGTDHVCINIQANGGNTNATIGTGLTSTNFYNAAVQLWGCDAVKFFGVNGEFADVGWYLGGTSSAAGGAASTHVSINEFVDARGDYNAAHGLYFVGAAWNQFHSLMVNNNSNNTNGAYDGVYLSNSTSVFGNRFATVIGSSPAGAANMMGYYFHDAATGGVSQLDSNIVLSIGGKRQGMAFDYALIQTPFRYSLLRGGAGSYAFRPASRHCAGDTWSDLFAAATPVLTYSDGGGATSGTGLALIGNGGWRLASSGALSGNLLNAVTVECLGGSSAGWLGVTSSAVTSGAPVTAATSTFTPVCFNAVTGTNPAIIQKLGNNQILQVTTNAAGNTAGTTAVLTPAVISGVTAATAYAACVSTVAATTGRNVKFIIDCFNGATFLSSITSDTGVSNSPSAVSTHNFTFTTPASTNALQVRVVFTGAVTNEIHYVGLMSVDTHSTQTVPVYS